MALSSQRKKTIIVYSTIVLAGFAVVFLNFDFASNITSGRSESSAGVNREALSKVAPAMTDRAFHQNYKSQDQCITCHTQQVMGAPNMPHEPRERCEECHQIQT